MAAISYDSVEVPRTFAKRAGITIPLLSDPKSEIIKAFGILNTTVPRNTEFYGVPFPGTYIVDERGRVKSKLTVQMEQLDRTRAPEELRKKPQ